MFNARSGLVLDDEIAFPSGLPSGSPLQQIGRLHAQRDGQRLDVVDREVDEPGLDLTDVRLVEIGELG